MKINENFLLIFQVDLDPVEGQDPLGRLGYLGNQVKEETLDHLGQEANRDRQVVQEIQESPVVRGNKVLGAKVDSPEVRGLMDPREDPDRGESRVQGAREEDLGTRGHLVNRAARGKMGSQDREEMTERVGRMEPQVRRCLGQ